MPRPVPVSKLAEYAEDPEGYCRRKGGARSEKAARYGSWRHATVASGRNRSGWLIKLAVLAALGYAAARYMGWLA
jgi:hypothetical protein